MTTDFEPIASVPMIGGAPCLDFANTTSERQSGAPSERLAAYGDLLVWAERAGLVAGEEAAHLASEAAARPAAARAALGRALELREALYRLFSARAAGEAAADADVALLNATLRQAQGRRVLGEAADGFAWEWAPADEPLEAMLGPIANSAAELLTSGELARVKECTNRDCGWLFVDASRNRSRRWCDMRDCGNRAKARRHYARRRTQERAG